jgi:hypothetical protein
MDDTNKRRRVDTGDTNDVRGLPDIHVDRLSFRVYLVSEPLLADRPRGLTLSRIVGWYPAGDARPPTLL